MKKRDYRQRVAFINRQRELDYLREFINKEPSEILFWHGPKSSGKTTLLYKLFEQIQQEDELDIKFLNLREVWLGSYHDFLDAFFVTEDADSKEKSIQAKISVGIFSITSDVKNKMAQQNADPFTIMKTELSELVMKGKKPVIIIDELQALEGIYYNGQRELIHEILNFFVAMTKESHLAHVIISSSDGYFVDTVYTESRLRKCSKFYKVDYLDYDDTMEWLLNIEKFNNIKDFQLNQTEADKIWDTVGGSMWEIQSLLSELSFDAIDDVLEKYKRQMKAMIADYIHVRGGNREILKRFVHTPIIPVTEFTIEDDPFLRDMVRNNILYYDPMEAIYYPQGKSMEWGIKLYFD
jgi:AAA+ ATPase superfamily predicted ATPase